MGLHARPRRPMPRDPSKNRVSTTKSARSLALAATAPVSYRKPHPAQNRNVSCRGGEARPSPPPLAVPPPVWEHRSTKYFSRPGIRNDLVAFIC